MRVAKLLSVCKLGNKKIYNDFSVTNKHCNKIHNINAKQEICFYLFEDPQ